MGLFNWRAEAEAKEREKAHREVVEYDKQQEQKYHELVKKYNPKSMQPHEIVLLEDDGVDENHIIQMLQEFHGYGDYGSENPAWAYYKTIKEENKKLLKKKEKAEIRKKLKKHYGIPDDNRQPIPEEVKDSVWRRDGGACVKCSSRESLEFDHIIPISQGGSNTARNIQILCEKCNREKSDNIG